MRQQEELMLVELMRPGARCPQKAHDGIDGDACYDLWTDKDFEIRDVPQGAGFKIPLGIKVAIKPGYCAEIRSRSGITLNGLPAKKLPFKTDYRANVSVEPGTVDCNYRDEVCVLCVAKKDFKRIFVPAGAKIAQMKIESVPQGEVKVVDHIDMDTDRKGGFGSTGIR